MQSTKYSTASKKRMAKMPKEKRSANAAVAGSARQASMTAEQRKRHAKMMVTRREEKRNAV